MVSASNIILSTSLGMAAAWFLSHDDVRTKRTVKLPFSFRSLLALVGFACGFWVAGRRNLVFWIEEVNTFLVGDIGPDPVTMMAETFEVLMRILIGGYGVYKILQNIVLAAIC